MPDVVIYLLIFTGLGAFFLFIHLLMGKLVRPDKPEADKLTIYECGEPTIGTAWVQFDLRYYVIALLFVIFDVEVAFFFPWAIVYGKANMLAQQTVAPKDRIAMTKQLDPDPELAVPGQATAIPTPDGSQKWKDWETENRSAAYRLAVIGFFDILVFFGVLLVGFAYLWKRGDINWVRSIASEEVAETGLSPPASAPREEALV